MTFTPFALETWQSLHEQEVRYNLADSGVHPVTLSELVDTDVALADLLAVTLHYPEVCGTERLRELIAGMHPGATADDVLVTVGAAEANSLVAQTLVGRGDHVVVLEPSYRQMWGAMRNLGAEVDAFTLRRELAWRPDLDELRSMLRPTTRLVCITNPNNPVGTILTPDEIGEIVAACDRVGAWLLVDEVYRGSERSTDVETPTAWGRSERVVTTGSLSKSYGLSGLRIGWLVAGGGMRDDAWRRHEYLTISAASTSMHLAELALAEPMRQRLVDRTRGFIRDGWSIVESWLAAHPELVSAVPPEASALAFVRYHLDLPSGQVAELLRRAGVLVAPGAAFGIEQHLRITHGVRPDHLTAALEIVADVLRSERRHAEV